ncbi:MAG: hypothetical protein ACPGNT_05335 [Rhodospirillales bacterium]
MARRLHCQWMVPDKPVVLFLNAEEAWFWYVQSQTARLDGARFRADATDWARPCTPDDIASAVLKLRQTGKLTRHHLNVLLRFGHANRRPDARIRDEQTSAQLWDEALDRLHTVLNTKGLFLS